MEKRNAELELLYVRKLVQCLNLEVDLGCISEDECESRMEEELKNPNYCTEARQYIQNVWNDMTDKESSDYWWSALWRRMEVEAELFGSSYLDPPAPENPEDDPRYPDLKELRGEVKVLEHCLEFMWTA